MSMLYIAQYSEWRKNKYGAGDNTDRLDEYKQWVANGKPEDSPAPVPESSSQPSIPDAQQVSKDQMAAQQADPASDQGVTEGGESVSRKRRGRATGKKTLSVRRASGSGINI